jgi:hypothetical protein
VKPKPARPRLSTSGNPHWCTPEWILDPIRAIDPFARIALDPCSNRKSLVDAVIEWRGPRARQCRVDGLKVSWGPAAYRAIGCRSGSARRPGGRIPLVYINPPYSRGVVACWVARCAEQAASELYPLHVVSLVPARLSASWYRAHCYPGGGSQAVCQLGRRVRFIGADSPCPWEMSLVYWGPAPEVFALSVRSIGAVYRSYELSEGLQHRPPLLAFYPQHLEEQVVVANEVDSAS